jgi:hypothetical protein
MKIGAADFNVCVLCCIMLYFGVLVLQYTRGVFFCTLEFVYVCIFQYMENYAATDWGVDIISVTIATAYL